MRVFRGKQPKGELLEKEPQINTDGPGFFSDRIFNPSVANLLREHNIALSTFYRETVKYGGMDINEARRLKALEPSEQRAFCSAEGRPRIMDRSCAACPVRARLVLKGSIDFTRLRDRRF